MGKRILTGLKPTGELHLGNYFGAIQQIVAMQEGGEEVFLFVADLHALTGLSDREVHRRDEQEQLFSTFVRSFTALGIDPNRVMIYRQSDFPQITELAWIFACMVKMPFLTIGHAYKDAVQKGSEPSVGTFLYPALMAADILLPDAAVVPVGKDQVQHIEITREFARRFHRLTGTDYFTEPEERAEDQMTVPGIDGEKMSKSYRNTIPIFGSEEVIRQQIQSIKTDSTPAGEPIDPATCLICTYLKLMLSEKEYLAREDQCRSGGVTYKELKDQLADAYLAYFAKAREQYQKTEGDGEYVDRILEKNRDTLNTLFSDRLHEAKRLLGLVS
ncbi:MAG: tryptophan--tRNA ligase [Candidatus Kaiserbacteria bacterium]|nr:tryptophan--tRNA ligase [Candidatus Kaiserbacteria bacterium]